MSRISKLRRAGLTALLLFVVASVTVAPAMAYIPVTTTASQSFSPDVSTNLPEDQVFKGSDDGQIEVWNRFAFPFRSDDTSASTQIPYPADVIGAAGFGQKDLIATFGTDKNPAGVFTAGDEVSLSFKDGRAGMDSEALEGQQRVEVVAARITGSEKGFPSTTSDAIDLLGDIENANENASFQMVENGTSLDGDGELTTSFTPEAGQYVVFTAVHESNKDGFEVNHGDLSVDGDVMLLGMDQISVAESTAMIDVSDANVGDNVTFDVDASSAFSDSADVTHAVALYDNDTFANSRVELEVDTTQLGPDFDLASDSTLRYSIKNVNGIADVEDGISVNGVDLADGEIARTVSAVQTIDFITANLNSETPATTPIKVGGANKTAYENLNASVTAISGATPQTNVTVDTFANFSTGEYQYVVYSMRDDSSSVTSTANGTISLTKEDESDTGDDDDGDNGDGGSNGDGGGDGGGAIGGGNDTPTDTPTTDTPTDGTPSDGTPTDDTPTDDTPTDDTPSDTGTTAGPTDAPTPSQTETTAPGPEETTTSTGPGFGLVGAIAALILAGFVARRRQ